MKKNQELIGQHIAEYGTESIGLYYSIYRGVVLENDDPEGLNRLKIYVPELDIIEWALPRGIPGSYMSGSRQFVLPRFNEIVYITFENGNPALPLWEYHGWGSGQIPGEFQDPDMCGIITPKGVCVLVNDRTGEVFIQAQTRMIITAEGDEGMVIKGQNLFLNSLDQVQINQGTQEAIYINELTEKLNNLVKELEDLRQKFNTHVHTGVTTGPGSSGITTSLATRPFSQFNKDDYKDKKLLH